MGRPPLTPTKTSQRSEEDEAREDKEKREELRAESATDHCLTEKEIRKKERKKQIWFKKKKKEEDENYKTRPSK